MAARAEEGLVRRDKPYQQAEGLVALAHLEPGDGAVNGEIVRVDVFVALLLADLSVAPFLEERTHVVVAGIVVAEVIIPMTLFNAVVNMHLADDGNLVAGIAQQVGEERNVGGQWNLEKLIGRARPKSASKDR